MRNVRYLVSAVHRGWVWHVADDMGNPACGTRFHPRTDRFKILRQRRRKEQPTCVRCLRYEVPDTERG